MNTDTLTNGSTVKNHISIKTVFEYNATRRISFRSCFVVYLELLQARLPQHPRHLQVRKLIILRLPQARLPHQPWHLQLSSESVARQAREDLCGKDSYPVSVWSKHVERQARGDCSSGAPEEELARRREEVCHSFDLLADRAGGLRARDVMEVVCLFPVVGSLRKEVVLGRLGDQFILFMFAESVIVFDPVAVHFFCLRLGVIDSFLFSDCGPTERSVAWQESRCVIALDAQTVMVVQLVTDVQLLLRFQDENVAEIRLQVLFDRLHHVDGVDVEFGIEKFDRWFFFTCVIRSLSNCLSMNLRTLLKDPTSCSSPVTKSILITRTPLHVASLPTLSLSNSPLLGCPSWATRSCRNAVQTTGRVTSPLKKNWTSKYLCSTVDLIDSSCVTSYFPLPLFLWWSGSHFGP